MSDWKKDLERKLAARKEAEAKCERKSLEKARRESDRQAEEAAREYAKRLEGHKRHFKCHVCGNQSGGPGEKIVGRTRNTDPEGMDWDPVWGTDWDKPTGLERCH